MGTPFPQPGEHFAQRYRIVSEVGSGGFARIYHAIQTDLQRDVALKILEPSPFDHLSQQQRREFEGQLNQRFQREARNVAQLRDPHTVTLYDYGRSPEGLMYMVFEYIDGRDLQFAASQQISLEPGRVAHILEQVLRSLHEAHSLGFLHRDIKPANVMLYEHVGRPDCVKVLDFGIAKALLGDANLTLQDLTGDGIMLGTPRYMSPEQLRGEEIGPPSDLYSVGLVIYELFVGRKAITIDNTHEIINRQISREPITLPDSPAIPEQLRATVDRLLAKSAADRFSTAAEVLEHLESHRPSAGATVGPRTGGSDAPHGETAPRKADGWNRAADGSEGGDAALNWTPLLLAAAGVVVAGLAGFGLYAALQGSEGPTGAAAGASPPRPATAPANGPSKNEAPAGPAPTRKPDDEREGQPAPARLKIQTTPSGADVWINDQRFGEAPVHVATESISFPADIRAAADGHYDARTLREPTDRVVLELVPPDEDEAARSPNPEPSSPDEATKAAAPNSRNQPDDVDDSNAAPSPPDDGDRDKSGDGTAEKDGDSTSNTSDFPALDL